MSMILNSKSWTKNNILLAMCAYSDLKNRITTIIRLQENLPKRMNVIASAARGKLKEIAHSMILADLLRDSRILHNFLDKFMPNCCHGEYNYIVRREFQHMDICLENELNFIIIENKVNGAIEQASQIFRYVSQAKKNPSKKFVLYLNPVSRTSPSQFSLNNKGVDSVFSSIPKENLIVISYAYDIVPWLENLLSQIDQSEENVKTSIFQYLDYLKIKFNLASMQTNNIKKELDSLLGINPSCNIDRRIGIYNEEIKKIESYSNEIGKIKIQISKEKAEDWAKYLQENWGQDVDIKHNDNDDKTGFVMTLQQNIEIIVTTTDCKPWWGIRVHDEKTKNMLKSVLDKQFPEIKTENSTWDYWCYTSFSNMCNDIRIIHDELDAFIKSLPKDFF